jgi:predicted outer membrane repeat protein
MSRPDLRRSFAVAILLFLVLALGADTQCVRAMVPHEVSEDGRSWMNGYTMVLLEEGADIQNARRWVQAQGGQVALMLPPRVLTGWIPESLDATLIGHAGIRSIHRSSGPSASELVDVDSRVAVESFERIVQGRLSVHELDKPQSRAVLPPGGDAIDPGPLSAFEVLQNLERNDTHNVWKLNGGDAITANSDYMVGTVSVTLFFVESSGSGSDPDQFDWTSAAEQDVFDEAVAGLSWWSQQASLHGECWVTFLLQAHYATQDSRCAQPREAVLHDSDTYASVVANVLANFGYGVGSHLSRATAYNTAQRLANETDWAYSAFIAANPTGATFFTDGRAAWAFLGGPYTAMLQRSFTWQFRRVFAHESGHIFGACDEYHVEGYGGCNGCEACWTSGVPNGNCELCNDNSVPCMMKENSWALCEWTQGQVGWWRSPCIAGPLPPPLVDSMTPTVMAQAETGIIDLTGADFNYGTSVDLGEGIVIEQVERVSSNVLRLTVAVDSECAPGARDLQVTGPDGGTTTLQQAFAIRATRVHYVSSYGSDTFPFDSPLSASGDLAKVLSVASAGDTLRLVSGTWGSLSLQKSLVVEGGWATDFESRLPEALPTVLQAAQGSVLRISGATTHAVLDGLIIRGGRGTALSTPQLGTTTSGGGILSMDASPVFRDCVIENNQAGGAGQHGVGGAAFLFRSHATFEDCVFRNNSAGDGGALFVLESEVTLRRNHLESNHVDVLWGSAQGAAIHLQESRATIEDDVFENNSGASSGGALYLTSGSRIQAIGATLRAHSVTGSGAAVWSQDSSVELAASTISANSAGNLGGGVYAHAGSLTVTSSVFAGNQAATLGGGLYCESNAPLLANLSLTGNDGGPASGLYLSNVQPGAQLTNSVFAFNVIGALIFASGTPPILDWNVYWQNGALDVVGIGTGEHDTVMDPLWVDPAGFDVHPARHSPLVDSGDPAWLDPDGSRSDRGAHGGPQARSLAPPRTLGLASQPTRLGTRLTWDPSLSPQVVSYVVYRGETADFQPGIDNAVAEVAAPTTTWEDVQPPEGSWYKVAAIDAANRAGGYSGAVEVEQTTAAMPRRHRLHLDPVYPNPTNPQATIAFSLPQAMPVQVTLFDVRGRRVRGLTSGPHAAGGHRLTWDGRDDDGRAAASGVYWIRLQTSERVLTRKLILVR